MLGAYRPLFGRPGAPRIIAASVTARLAIGAFTLPLILAVQEATGSFATAGLVAGAFSLGVALAAPLRGRLIDRHGARDVLPGMAVVSGLGLAAIAIAAEAAPSWVLVAVAGVAGAATPPLVASMRLEWQRLLGRGDPRLTQAYAFESAVQTAVFVVGPLLAGLAIALAGAREALGASAALLLVGTLAFALVARTTPDPDAVRGGSPIRLPAVLTLVLATTLADAALGAVDVIVPAFAQARGKPELAGVLLAVFAASAVAGALAYGRRSWEAPATRQLAIVTLCGAAAVALLALPDTIVVLGLALAVAGAPSAAQWAAASLALDEASGGSAGAEAFTWLSAANGIGIAAGSALGGVLVEHAGTGTAFLVAAVFPALAAALLVARRDLAAVAGGR